MNSTRDTPEIAPQPQNALQKKKKQTNKRRRVIIGIQTDTQSSVSWVLDSHSPPKYNFEPWTSPSYIRFFFFLNLFMRNKYTHTQGRKKWILIQKHTTNSTPTLLPNSILNLEPHLHIIIFFFLEVNTHKGEKGILTQKHTTNSTQKPWKTFWVWSLLWKCLCMYMYHIILKYIFS